MKRKKESIIDLVQKIDNTNILNKLEDKITTCMSVKDSNCLYSIFHKLLLIDFIILQLRNSSFSNRLFKPLKKLLLLEIPE